MKETEFLSVFICVHLWPILGALSMIRREFLWQMGGGFVGTALTYLLARDGFFARAAPAPNPLAPRKPHFPAKARACICLFMYGGPSQVDLWDPKPELAKRTGQPMPNLD